jgi:hypothetical protein
LNTDAGMVIGIEARAPAQHSGGVSGSTYSQPLPVSRRAAISKQQASYRNFIMPIAVNFCA